MIETANPFASLGFAGAIPDRFFLAEIDVLWERSQVEAKRIVREYRALGANHVMTGPVYAHGYHGHYPDTDWLNEPDAFAACLRWLASEGLAVTLVVAPDCAPYYDDRARTFDWAAMARLADFYRRLRSAGIVLTRVCSQWEQWQRRDEAARLFEWMRELFPEAQRYWHSPPGHLSPGAGDEEERGTWESACAHGIHGLLLQADPPSSPDPNKDGRAPIDQMRYDLADMVRRARGINSPWGDPILTERGVPFEIVYAEGCAYSMYWSHTPQSTARAWGQAALQVDGITDTLDGLP